MKPFSLYIHIPFCFHKCPYCDFNTYAVSQTPEDDYVSALLAELDYYAAQPEWEGREIQTIYFGGGTPSLFHPKSFRRLLFFICKTFPVSSRVEITLEANPGTITVDNLSGYRFAGINRLSIGAQSFNAQVLKTLGRIHSVDQTAGSFEAARLSGFSNISLDIMFGVPGQTLADFRRDLSELTSLAPDHVSAYGLTIEKGTEFYSAFRKGKLVPPPDDAMADMMIELWDYLETHGYSQYEISNFARRQREARHNLAYWNGNDYLGLGAGAHSMYEPDDATRVRWSNYALPKQYMEHASAFGKTDSWRDTLGVKDLMFEFFYLGLRKTAGVSLSAFENTFGFSVEAAYPGILEVLLQKEFLLKRKDQIAFTRKGMLVTDSVIENFIDDQKELPSSTIAPSGTAEQVSLAAN